jgi:gluconate 5-dehydrogenase
MTTTHLFDLSGKTALITGGSRGLGLQIAEALGDAGARLVISSRKAADLETAKAHLEGRGITVDYIAADNSQDADVLRLADETIAKLGKVDILVNNAGATWGAPAEDHPIEAWDKVMNLNVRSLFVLSQQIAKRSMIPNHYGRILNLASIAGLRGSPGVIAYHYIQGGGGELHPRTGGRLGALRDHRQCACPRHVPLEDDGRHIQGKRR